MNILIADRQPLIRRGIIEILSSNQDEITFFEAGNSSDLLRIIQVSRIDIALIDFEIRSEYSMDLVQECKMISREPLKFIFLVQSISIFEMKRAKELQIDGFILKDAPVEDILYAFKVIKRGEKFYPSKMIEKAFSNVEGEGLKLLTEREMDVFSELRKGLNNGQISSNLYIAEGTTKKHISNILNKLKLSNRTEVVIYANKLYSNQNS